MDLLPDAQQVSEQKGRNGVDCVHGLPHAPAQVYFLEPLPMQHLVARSPGGRVISASYRPRSRGSQPSHVENPRSWGLYLTFFLPACGLDKDVD